MAMPTPTAAPQIQGSLPFGSGGANFDFSGNPANLSANYATAYNDALAQNKANYENILSGFQQTAQNQSTAQQAIAGGYTGLYNNLVDAGNRIGLGYGALQSGVQGTINNIGASQQQAINDYYRQQQGQATQSLVDRGLGNTTVVNSVQRGIGLDQQKANVALANQMAQLSAGYQSNLGLAGLNYANQAALQAAGQGNLGLGYQAQAAQQNSALAQNQLAFMNSTSAPYPNAGLYGQLATQWGAAQQANADRAQAAQQFNQLQAAARQPVAASGGGYVPSGGGFSPPQSFGGGYSFQPGAPGTGQINPAMYGTSYNLPAATPQYSPGGSSYMWDAIGGGSPYSPGGADYVWNALGSSPEEEAGGGYAGALGLGLGLVGAGAAGLGSMGFGYTTDEGGSP